MKSESGGEGSVVPFREPPMKGATDAATDALDALGLQGAELPSTEDIANRNGAQREATAAMLELMKTTGFAFVITSIPLQANYEKLATLASVIQTTLHNVAAETGVATKDLFPVPVEVVVSEHGRDAYFSDMPPRGITLHLGLECTGNEIKLAYEQHKESRSRGAGNDN